MMRRFLALLLILSMPWPVIAQDEMKQTPKEDQQPIPKTLAEAHAELERMLPPTELAKIDSMATPSGMGAYHLGLGMWMRNNWGLWSGSPLAAYLRKLGFGHPEAMSGVILETFWCKRHGQDFRLQERAAEFAREMEAARKADEDEEGRVTRAKAEMPSMMMGLRYEKREVPVVRMPDRIDAKSIRARFVSLFGDGVFLAVRVRTGLGEDFVTVGYYFNRADHQLHKLAVPEIAETHSVVVAGRTAWFTGVKEGKSVLVGIEGKKRMTVLLPFDGLPPQLGLDQQTLLAVYPKDVFRLADTGWEHLFSGQDTLPKSGPPPELHGNMLFLRDEGRGENDKRLWWLQLGAESALTSLDRDVKVVGPSGPRWENSFSYAFTPAGDLWACVGEGYARKSLLRRAKDGTYSIAIMNNSVRFTPDLFGSAQTDQGISVSAVALDSAGAILLVGDAGLYRLNAQELTQELAFAHTSQEVPIDHGTNIDHWEWDPSNVLPLEHDSYFITGAFGGIYLLEKDTDGKWSFLSLDEHLGEPVVW